MKRFAHFVKRSTPFLAGPAILGWILAVSLAVSCRDNPKHPNQGPEAIQAPKTGPNIDPKCREWAEITPSGCFAHFDPETGECRRLCPELEPPRPPANGL